ALQWQPPLMDIAKRHGWRLYMSTKSTCPIPSVTVYRSNGELAPDCDAWRESVLAQIGRLRPDLVIAANRNDYHILGGYDIDSADNQRLWHDGLMSSLSRLKSAAGEVLLLGDSPHWTQDIPSCLTAHPDDMSACGDRRSAAISSLRTANDRAAAAEVGVSFRTTAHLVCPYDPCPVIIDDLLLIGDYQHLTPPFTLSVARGLERLLP
ncbi:MAG: hypothetical protein LH650_09715, partial [Chloroflexi bacterium]|nr:hypothetical protein [Chloroflexota bacterium]